MKVFVSSTCHDLIDLRAELREELRDLGVQAYFSDQPDSDFEVSGAPGADSIEVCLANLRACDVVVVVLSQRYGGPLGDRYGNLSATHCEYREARKQSKRIYFYVRDRLEAEFAVWKRNKPFKGAWIKSPADMPIFDLLEEHRKLEQPAEEIANNWLLPFRNSFDMRADLRRRLQPLATKATAERMIEEGDGPLLVVAACQPYNTEPDTRVKRSTHDLWIENVGNMAALNVTVILDFQGVASIGSESSAMAALAVGGKSDKIEIAVPLAVRQQLNDAYQAHQHQLWCRVRIGYTTQAGYMFSDVSQVNCIATPEGLLAFRTLPVYDSKQFGGWVSRNRHG